MIEDAESKGLITPGKVISQIRYLSFRPGLVRIGVSDSDTKLNFYIEPNSSLKNWLVSKGYHSL